MEKWRLRTPALEECIDILFRALFALLICHSAHLVQVRPHRTVVVVLGNWSSAEKTQGKLGCKKRFDYPRLGAEAATLKFNPDLRR